MSASLNQSEDRSRFRRTFWAEALRSVAAGFIETALATFAILLAVKLYTSGPAVKSLLIGSPAIGLLGSLLMVPLVARTGLTASRAAACISLLSMLGFLLAAVGANSEICFIVGMTLGIGVISMAIPLQTHYLRINYPNRNRGRLFSVSIFLRALTALLVSWGFGEYLDRDLSRYPVLLWTFVGAAGVSAVCHFLVPSESLREKGDRSGGLLDAVQVSRSDRIFVRLLVAAMILGLGVLASNALRVDYLVNPEHGLNFDVKTVSLITGIIPSIVRLASTILWGWLFDRMDFFRLRIIVNLIFLAGIFLYFTTGKVELILAGSALFGLARGGGEILFNLFVTRLAKPGDIAQYMSVHTFLAGIRILLAPFIGFFLVLYTNIPVMVVFCTVLVISSVLIVGSASGLEQRSRKDG